MKPTQKTISWEIEQKPIYSNNSQLRNYQAIFRNDNGQLLNVAKTSYTPTPNQRFVEVVEKMQEITGFPLQTYDEFEGGKKVLAFLECTEAIKVYGYDFKDYMIIGNSHDSSTGFFMGNSSKMIRCSNRFSKIFRQLQVHHTKNHDVKIDGLLRYFETYMRERKELYIKMARMHTAKIESSIKKALVERLTRMNEEEKLGIAELSPRKRNLIDNINASIERECLDLGDTAFGLLQGITHHTTHVRKNKEEVFGNVLGGAARINEEAFRFCEQLIAA
jgi:hypothetical protein